MSPRLDYKYESYPYILEGTVYFVFDKNSDFAFSLFAHYSWFKLANLVITTKNTDEVCSKYPFHDTRIIHILPVVNINAQPDSPEEVPLLLENIVLLSNKIMQYIDNFYSCIILFEPLELFVQYHGFETMMKFVDNISDTLQTTHSTVIFLINPGIVPDKYMVILKRNFECIKPPEKVIL